MNRRKQCPDCGELLGNAGQLALEISRDPLADGDAVDVTDFPRARTDQFVTDPEVSFAPDFFRPSARTRASGKRSTNKRR